MEIQSHGYSFKYDKYDYVVLINSQLDDALISQLRTVLGETWLPNIDPSLITICVNDETGFSLYHLQFVFNLISIHPLYVNVQSAINTQIYGILEYIYSLIRLWTNSSALLANEIIFKLAFYRNSRDNILSTLWPGKWRFSRNTSTTICGTELGVELAEYRSQWRFDRLFNLL